MTDYIVGIDCATDSKKRGIAVARYAESACTLVTAAIGTSDDELIEIINKFFHPNNRVLLALDAPLGWPSKMGMALTQHQAGQGLPMESNDLFRRRTDHFVKKEYDIQSLDVGADRIARTAHSALQLMENLRWGCRQPIPLAMNANFTGVAAIEVYPAATLKICRLPFRKYKKAVEAKIRQAILDGLVKMGIVISENVQQIILKSADALDAAVCVLSGMDFLTGKAKPPQNPLEQEAAKKEGWIWVRMK